MLIQFRFKNHKSFCEDAILDMTATQEKRHKDHLIEVNGNELLSTVAIYGANAAGKTTVIDALNYMFNYIKKSRTIDINLNIVTYPFLFDNKSRNEASEYEISICLKDIEYRYGFAITKTKILEEWLYKRPFNNTTRAQEKLIFERQEEKVIFANNYANYKKMWSFYAKEMDTSKLLVLSNIATKFTDGPIKDLYDYIKESTVITENNQKESIILLKDETLNDKFTKIINEFDPCLKGILIEEIKDENDNSRYQISGVHKNIDNNKLIKIPMSSESNGTYKMFNIIPSMLISLKTGGLLCIDELDIELHPLLFKKLISMYQDPKTNPNHAQLIFTTHNTTAFNYNNSRKDEIYFVEKDNDGKSKLYSLSDFKNVRSDADYEKKYFAGQFGAIPYDED